MPDILISFRKVRNDCSVLHILINEFLMNQRININIESHLTVVRNNRYNTY